MDETTLTEVAHEKACDLRETIKFDFPELAERLQPIIDELFNEVKKEHGQA